MKKSFIFTMLTLTILQTTHTSTPHVIITPLSRSILYLLYITQRLEPSLKLMQNTINHNHIDRACSKDVVSFFLDTHLIKTDHIRNVLVAIQEKHSLQPLFDTWHQIKQFRYGIKTEEKAIILDFSKICLIAYQTVLFKVQRNQEDSIEKITPIELASLEQIDQIFEKIEQSTFSYFLKESTKVTFSKQVYRPENNLTLELSTSFAFRFYLNKRLQKAFQLLSKFNEKDFCVFHKGTHSLGFNKEDLSFKNWIVHSYFESLITTKNLTPMMQLIEQFESFDFIKSPLFVREFLILLCLVYKDIFFNTAEFSKTPLASMEELETLSIEQLLAIIDIVTEKIHHLPTQPLLTKPLTWLEAWWQGLGAALVAGTITYMLTKNQTTEPSIFEMIKEEYGVEPDVFTHLVFSRYYFIKRLNEIIKVLIYLNQHETSVSRTPLPLKPLSLAWQDFVAYKDLANPELIEDFTKEIHILSQHFLHEHLASQSDSTAILENFFLKDLTPLQGEQPSLATEIASSIEVNKVIMRFYYVRRLEGTMEHLQTLQKKSLLCLPESPASFTESPYLTSLHFEQKPILTMLEALKTSHSFKPLFSMWNDLQRYKYINDEKVFKEYTQFVTQLLHATIAHYAPFSIKGPLLNHLNNMPLEDILNLLDILVEELPDFLEKTELTSESKLTWQEWFKKYWLIAPISAAIFGIKLYMMHKGVIDRPTHLADIPAPAISTHTPA